MERKWLIFLLIFLLFASVSRSEPKQSGDLTGTAIDLLMGTPEGMVEPLDQRRNSFKPDQNLDFKDFLDYDSTFEANSQADFSWQEAEETDDESNPDGENLIDLISEIEDIENQQFDNGTREINDNISDYIETEIKL